MGTLRGFGMTFDIATGCMRIWYVDSYGVMRWKDNDEVRREELPPVARPPEGGGNGPAL